MPDATPPPLPDDARRPSPSIGLGLASLVAGSAVDWLALRHDPGFGLAVALVAGAAFVLSVGPAADSRPPAVGRLVAVLLALALVPAVRDSTELVVIAILAYGMVAAVVVRMPAAPDLQSWTMTDYVRQGSNAVARAVGEAAGYAAGVSANRAGLRRVRPYALGVVAVAPLLAVFGGLFASGDAVFAAAVSDLFALDLDVANAVGRVVTSVALGLAIVGVVGVLRKGSPVPRLRTGDWSLDPRSVAAATAALVLLFAAFVWVQFTYLFSGRETLEVAGVSFSEYARRGFFEMVAVAALVAIVVLVADWLVGDTTSRSVRGWSVALIALTLVVVASAAYRMRLYTSAFGLTELRLYTAVFMGWTAVVLLLAVRTITTGRRSIVAFGMFLSGLAVVLGLAVVNPARIIVEVNTARSEVDYDYLRSLGPDALPALVAADPSEGCTTTLAHAGDWRSTTVAEIAARRALAACLESG